MELQAVLGRVVEAPELAESEVAVVGEPGVAGDLPSQFQQAVEDMLEFLRLLQTPVGHQLPALLPQRTVRLFQVAAHLHQRLLFTAELHGQRPAQLLILLVQPRFLRLQRHILLPE